MPKFNFHAGAAAASVLLALLVIIAELAAPFKAFLASVFGHHWIGKAVLISIVFIVVGFLYKKESIFGVKNEKLSWYGTLGSLAAIFLFYLAHYFVA